MTQTWDEASADWTHASTSVTWPGGGAVDLNHWAIHNIAPGALGYYDWNITALVNAWLGGTYQNFGIQLNYVAVPPVGDYIGFATRDDAIADHRPQLLVTP